MIADSSVSISCNNAAKSGDLQEVFHFAYFVLFMGIGSYFV